MLHLAPALVQRILFSASPRNPPFQPVALVTPRGGLESP